MAESATSRLQRAQVIDGLILAAIVGLLLWAVLGHRGSEVEGLVGQTAPAFRLKTVQGDVTGPPDHGGKVVMLDFWATWCTPCARQMPTLQAVADERGDQVVVLPINVDAPGAERLPDIERFMSTTGLRADSLLDDGSAAALYGVGTIPSLVLIDPQGRIAYASSGVHTAQEINRRIDAITKNE